MCLLILAHRASPQYPLLVAANRDEFHQRPTTPSGFWSEHPSLLAGRDEELGGTWMGVTREGKFAAVTNFRDPAASADAPRSRGELPLNYLLGHQRPAAPVLTDLQLAGRRSPSLAYKLILNLNPATKVLGSFLSPPVLVTNWKSGLMVSQGVTWMA